MADSTIATLRRHVDTLPSLKARHNVEVIVLGLSRTGTMSMYQALSKLGIRSYHMSEACRMTGQGHLKMWNEAMHAKYGPSPSAAQVSADLSDEYGPKDFDKLLQEYDALTDIPSILFIPELLDAYPQARLILTTHPRGASGWLRSINNSYFRIANWSIWDRLMIPYDNKFSHPYMTLVRRVMEIWTTKTWPDAGRFSEVEPRLRKFYAKHNDEMCRLARESVRELLEFEPAMGWEPLCRFLGREIPRGLYPHANEGNQVVNLHRVLVLMRLYAVFGGSIAKVGGTIAVLGAAWWWMQKGVN